jgi:hypothetical protein
MRLTQLRMKLLSARAGIKSLTLITPHRDMATGGTYVIEKGSPIVIDGRCIYDPDTFLKHGVQLVAIGLPRRLNE